MKGKKIMPVFFPGFSCPGQCIFCNQRSITGKIDIPSPEQVFALLDEGLPHDEDNPCYEVGFYGGSFTCAPENLQRAYLKAAAHFIERGRAKSVRLSTRPDALSDRVLQLLAQYPVSTIEVAAQSMDDNVLAKAGRGYTSDKVVKAAQLIREHGIEYAIQLMVGLPGETMQTALCSAEQAARTKPSAARIYPLIVLEATQLAAMYRSHTYTALSIEEAVARSKQTARILMDAGTDILRIGLQGSESLREAGTMVAGPWHDSFGELVYSAIYQDILTQICEYIKDSGISGKRLLLHVPKGSASQVAGNLKCNRMKILASHGLELKIEEKADVKRFELRLAACGDNLIGIDFGSAIAKRV